MKSQNSVKRQWKVKERQGRTLQRRESQRSTAGSPTTSETRMLCKARPQVKAVKCEAFLWALLYLSRHDACDSKRIRQQTKGRENHVVSTAETQRQAEEERAVAGSPRAFFLPCCSELHAARLSSFVPAPASQSSPSPSQYGACESTMQKQCLSREGSGNTRQCLSREGSGKTRQRPCRGREGNENARQRQRLVARKGAVLPGSAWHTARSHIGPAGRCSPCRDLGCRRCSTAGNRRQSLAPPPPNNLCAFLI